MFPNKIFYIFTQVDQYTCCEISILLIFLTWGQSLYKWKFEAEISVRHANPLVKSIKVVLLGPMTPVLVWPNVQMRGDGLYPYMGMAMLLL